MSYTITGDELVYCRLALILASVSFAAEAASETRSFVWRVIFSVAALANAATTARMAWRLL